MQPTELVGGRERCWCTWTLLVRRLSRLHRAAAASCLSIWSSGRSVSHIGGRSLRSTHTPKRHVRTFIRTFIMWPFLFLNARGNQTVMQPFALVVLCLCSLFMTRRRNKLQNHCLESWLQSPESSLDMDMSGVQPFWAQNSLNTCWHSGNRRTSLDMLRWIDRCTVPVSEGPFQAMAGVQIRLLVSSAKSGLHMPSRHT